MCLELQAAAIARSRSPVVRLRATQSYRVAGIETVHMGNDEVWRWWEARGRSVVEQVAHTPEGVSLRVQADYAEGIVVVLPAPAEPASVLLNGRPAPYEFRRELGGQWVCVICPQGESRVEIEW